MQVTKLNLVTDLQIMLSISSGRQPQQQNPTWEWCQHSWAEFPMMVIHPTHTRRSWAVGWYRRRHVREHSSLWRVPVEKQQQRFCFRESMSVLDQSGRIQALGFLAWCPQLKPSLMYAILNYNYFTTIYTKSFELLWKYPFPNVLLFSYLRKSVFFDK